MLARRIIGLNKRLVANRLANGYPTGMAYAGHVQSEAVALQDDPDYNLEYVDALFDPLPPRPLMMGINNTALAALREREQGNWGDLSADEQVKLYRSFFKNSFPEMLQPTDQWKGVLGAAFALIAGVLQAFQFVIRNYHHEEPNKCGLWYMYQPGWQQKRKNEAAWHIFWENENIESRQDCQYWDYTNHCWKNPNTVRLDEWV